MLLYTKEGYRTHTLLPRRSADSACASQLQLLSSLTSHRPDISLFMILIQPLLPTSLAVSGRRRRRYLCVCVVNLSTISPSLIELRSMKWTPTNCPRAVPFSRHTLAIGCDTFTTRNATTLTVINFTDVHKVFCQKNSIVVTSFDQRQKKKFSLTLICNPPQ